MKIFCLPILFKPILFRLFFRVDYEFEVYKFRNLQGKPQFSKIRKKQAIFGILPTFWLFLASRKNFFIGVAAEAKIGIISEEQADADTEGI